MGYFIAQSIGSLRLLLGGLALGSLSVGAVLLGAGLIIKIGLLPLHYWVPALVDGLASRGLYVLLSWQKIAPLSLVWFTAVRQLPWALGNAVGGGLLILLHGAVFYGPGFDRRVGPLSEIVPGVGVNERGWAPPHDRLRN